MTSPTPLLDLEEVRKRHTTSWDMNGLAYCTFCTGYDEIAAACDAIRLAEEVERLRRHQVDPDLSGALCSLSDYRDLERELETERETSRGLRERIDHMAGLIRTLDVAARAALEEK